jgi:protein TonB
MSDVSQLLESRRARIGRWAGAALIACALHAGFALALMQQHGEEDAEETAGAMTLELAPLPAPAPVDTPDVAHAPVPKEFSLPVPEAAKKVEQKVEEDIPPVDPAPAPEPEVTLPKPQPKEKDEPKEVAQEAQQSKQPPRDAKDEVTAAPPRVEAPPAPSLAPAKGASLHVARAQASWQTALMRQLNRHKRVPPGAPRGRRAQWETVVAFTLDRTGKVVDARITKSSGLPVLDQEALDLLRRVTFPPPPDELPGATFEYSLPIKFRVD